MTSERPRQRRYEVQALQPLTGALVVVWIDGELLDSYFAPTLALARARAAEAVGADVVAVLQSDGQS
jgi:hypothetical protein